MDFFDPMFDGKLISIGSSIEHSGKDTYFRDVHLFTDRMKDFVKLKGADIVRDNV